MDVVITARHCTVPDPVRLRTAERFERLQRYHPRMVSADAIFHTENGAHHVETRVLVARGGQPLVARGSGDGFRAALDQALDRLGRQLRRQRERRTMHKTRKPAELSATIAELA